MRGRGHPRQAPAAHARLARRRDDRRGHDGRGQGERHFLEEGGARGRGRRGGGRGRRGGGGGGGGVATVSPQRRAAPHPPERGHARARDWNTEPACGRGDRESSAIVRAGARGVQARSAGDQQHQAYGRELRRDARTPRLQVWAPVLSIGIANTNGPTFWIPFLEAMGSFAGCLPSSALRGLGNVPVGGPGEVYIHAADAQFWLGAPLDRDLRRGWGGRVIVVVHGDDGHLGDGIGLDQRGGHHRYFLPVHLHPPDEVWRDAPGGPRRGGVRHGGGGRGCDRFPCGGGPAADRVGGGGRGGDRVPCGGGQRANRVGGGGARRGGGVAADRQDGGVAPRGGWAGAVVGGHQQPIVREVISLQHLLGTMFDLII